MTAISSASAALGLALSGCGETPSQGAPVDTALPKPVRVERVQAHAPVSRVRVPGIVEARSRIPLAFRVAGFVERFVAEEGDRAEAGVVIAELDRRDVERELALAEVSLESAELAAAELKREYQRRKRLFEAKSTSRQVYEQARSAHQVAQVELRQSRLRLQQAEDRVSDSTLRAPVTGHIEKRLVESHQFVEAGQPVIVFSELDAVTVRATVSDRTLRRVQVGSPARIRSPAWPGREFEGHVSRISVAADPSTRTVPFEVEVANPDLALRPDTVVQVEIPTSLGDEVLALPMRAVIRDASLEPFCFIASEDGGPPRARRRAVKLGGLQGDRVVIVSGLSVGEQVVIQGQHFLSDGDVIHVLSSDPETEVRRGESR